MLHSGHLFVAGKHVFIGVVLLFADHISSPTATLFPVKELVAICRDRKVISVVDGAHTPGQIELDMDDLDPDFYVGRCLELPWHREEIRTGLLTTLIVSVVFLHFVSIFVFVKERDGKLS